MFAGKKSAQIREILISESAWEEMTCLFAPSLGHRNIRHTVWYTASNAGRFYGIWDNTRDKQRSSLIQ
ncbi:hypothetical protein CIG61_25090 [Klebsiella variicola]|nr:hypothetical protein CIG61_25090 [Klebsiella variicola]